MKRLLTCAMTFEPQRTVAYLHGELDCYTAECVVTRLAPFVTSGHDLVVNLSGLSFLGITGLALLDRLSRCADCNGGSLRLEDPSTAVQRLLGLAVCQDRFMIQIGRALPAA